MPPKIRPNIRPNILLKQAKFKVEQKSESRLGITTVSILLVCFCNLASTLASTLAVTSASASTSLSTLPSISAASSVPNEIKSDTQSVLGLKKYEESGTLTDAKLKADAGSLSKLSIRGNVSYFGPTLGDLSAADQPNPDGSVGNYTQAMRGSFSLRYRVNADSSISAGTGVSFIKPFHGWTRTDANNPFVSYDFSSRYGKLQMRNAPGMSVTTVPNFRNIGQIGGVSWDNSLVYAVGDSKLAVSFDSGINYWIFTRPFRPGPTRSGGDGLASQYSFSFSPGMKYNVSDRLNFNTSLGFLIFNPRGAENDLTLWSRTVNMRVGLGYAITRDIYLAPYLQGFVTRLSGDMTTLNFSGVFSIL